MATTTGFVQRLTLLSDSKLVCAWIGSAPNSVEAFFVNMTSSNDSPTISFKQSIVGLLTEAQLAGRSIAAVHDDNGAEITSIYTNDSDVSGTLQFDAIEITQSVQDLAHSIPLLAGKRTVVRLYLSYYSASPITVRGEISIRRSPVDPPLIVSSENVVVVDPAQAGNISSKRGNAARSLNFVLPFAHTAEGSLSINVASIVDSVNGASLSIGNERRPTVWFHRSPPLRVRILGMRYSQGTPPVVHTPTNLDFSLLISWLGRAYPVAQVVNSTAVVDVTAAMPFGCGDVNAQLAAIRTLDMDAGSDARTHYYGMASDGGFFMRGCAAGIPSVPRPDTVASGPTGPATWGWDFDGSYGDWYGGHELGHTFGRRHPGFCGETQDDLNNYPFPNGQLASSDASFVGFDVGDPINGIPMTALPGTQWHDFMTYCNFEWSSAYSYLGIRRRLVDEDQMASGSGGAALPVPQAFGGRPDQRFPHETILKRSRIGPEAAQIMISVVANVNLTKKEGKIKFVNPLKSGAPREPELGDMALIRVKDGENQTLHEYPVAARLSSELGPTDDRVGIVSAVIPVNVNARSLELVLDGKVVDTFTLGGVSREAGGPGVREEINRTFFVQISTDNEQSWQTVAVGLKNPSFTLDHAQFPAGELVQVRIIATDGLVNSLVSKESVRIKHSNL